MIRRRLAFDFFAMLVAVMTIQPTFAGSGAVGAEPCRQVTHLEKSYTVCRFEVGRQDLRLFWKQKDGQPFGSFPALANDLEKSNEELLFGMNAGMFHSDFSPVGLYIENGQELVPANLNEGTGNFFLKPNGVFYFTEQSAGILETETYLALKPHTEFATQSGPMLVVGGKLHPKLLPTTKDSSLKIRNGVGINGQQIYFAIANETVSFHDFATLFRDQLECSDALFLNGSISSVFIPELKRSDRWLPLGPIIGVTRKNNREE